MNKHSRIWDKRYGNQTSILDFAGRRMDRSAYGNPNSKYGWNLHHVLPESQGGSSEESNLVCANIKTNEEAADKTSFEIDGIHYQVQKIDGVYKIVNQKTKEVVSDN
ncbi:HNH nuclease domain-containing protein [[Mycoplasma] cavipharyngis]|uniref:HNH endonuclease n=1 Tax=[Mycoplasma] cavipharyngis TaxID=92757 RepID=UPI0037044D6B